MTFARYVLLTVFFVMICYALGCTLPVKQDENVKQKELYSRVETCIIAISAFTMSEYVDNQLSMFCYKLSEHIMNGDVRLREADIDEKTNKI